MYKYLIICNIFFISIIEATTVHPNNIAAKGLVSHVQSVGSKNKTAELVASEGGSILSTKTTLQEDNHSVLLTNLEKETSGHKGSVVAKKGVLDDENKSHEEDKTHDEITVSKNSTLNVANVTMSTLTANKVPTTLNKTDISKNVEIINNTKIHKPLTVSSEALNKMDKINNINIDANTQSIKVQAAKVSSHPEMIMPIIITILVVPMFAVLGYMALKRGQEAWKNRHYKRMDFLLDGMYND